MTRLDLSCVTLGALDAQVEKKALKSIGADFWKRLKEEGTRAWRIKDATTTQLLPEHKIGIFFSADCYVIVRTLKNDRKTHVFVWVGADATQEQYALATYLALRANQREPQAVLYREVMGRESLSFLSFFPGFMVLNGPAEKCFSTKKPKAYKPRFFRIQVKGLGRGRRCAITREVEISTDSLNVTDSFLIDEGLNIVLWHGRNTTPRDKILAQGVTQRLVDEREGKPSREFLDQGIDNEVEFFKKLGSTWHDVEVPAPDPEQAIPQGVARLMQVTLVPQPSLSELAIGDRVQQGLLEGFLQSTQIFLLDDGYGVAVWFGQGVDPALRVNAFNCAVHYMQENGRTLDTPILSVMQHNEPKLFFELFPTQGKPNAKPATCFDTSPSHRNTRQGDGNDFQQALVKQSSRSSVTSPQELFASLDNRGVGDADSDDDGDGEGTPSVEDQPETHSADNNASNSQGSTGLATDPQDKQGPSTETNAQQEQPLQPPTPQPDLSVQQPQPLPVQQSHPAPEPSDLPPIPPRTSRTTQPAPVQTSQSSLYYHTSTRKAEADAMLAGKPDGTFLLRPHPTGHVLSVVYNGAPTHHLIAANKQSGMFAVNGTDTAQSTLDGVLRVLSSKQPWWPVALTSGIPNGTAAVAQQAPTQTLVQPPMPSTPATATSLAAAMPYFHTAVTKAQAEAKLRGKQDGAFLLRPYGTSQSTVVLSVVYQGQPTHHALQFTPQQHWKVNQMQTTASTMKELVDYLRTKRDQWPVALSEAVVG
ncbi:hypothetical protein PTSG_11803 [Salpingoeca rosetta]|uniref:SH2 domain-containing protein n=1 Tax=Salpingoeca rosetta (strain ATCC 50818 / BSB-021) TaxID=946362 RepID=F2TZD0_SALR5|nr:uncharacterized protein PTSG_11803 [Salpingoeca rosetta]EGD78954.1 hypothetical protein PTSG_11803 [Salpingoeca rosetta]|eukprot:XP_004997910.1 hypothetical protein PTSG_11803 [Salpingoeca rosetta]